MECRRFALVGPFCPYRGGMAHSSESLRSGLRRRRHGVRPLTSRRPYPGWLFPGRSQLEPTPVAETGNALRQLDGLNPVTWERVARRIAGSDSAVIRHWLPTMSPPLAYAVRCSSCRTGRPALSCLQRALMPWPRPYSGTLRRACTERWPRARALSSRQTAGITCVKCRNRWRD